MSPSIVCPFQAGEIIELVDDSSSDMSAKPGATATVVVEPDNYLEKPTWPTHSKDKLDFFVSDNASMMSITCGLTHEMVIVWDESNSLWCGQMHGFYPWRGFIPWTGNVRKQEKEDVKEDESDKSDSIYCSCGGETKQIIINFETINICIVCKKEKK